MTYNYNICQSACNVLSFPHSNNNFYYHFIKSRPIKLTFRTEVHGLFLSLFARDFYLKLLLFEQCVGM